MFFAYFGLPLFLGHDLSPFAAATLSLALHASASMSEVIRAGIESVGRGQWEAARAFGLRYGRIMQLIVLPQAVPVIVPPSVGVFITVLKESTLASIIGYIELTRTGLLIRESTDGGFVPLLALAVLYFATKYTISLVGRLLERRFDAGRRPEWPGMIMAQHHALVDCVLAGDGAGAATVMQAHLRTASAAIDRIAAQHPGFFEGLGVHPDDASRLEAS